MSAEAFAPPPQSLSKARFAALFVATFCGLVAVGCVLPVLPRYVRGPIGGGDFAVGVVIGCYAISGLLLRPVAGRLADRWGRRPTAFVGMVGIAAGGALIFPALGIGGLILARLVLGAGEGFLYTSTSAWIVDMAPVERRGRILGLFGLAVWGGLAVGPLLGELLLQASGYRAVWTLATVLPALGAAVIALTTDPFRPQTHAEPHPLIAPEAVRPGVAVALASVGYATIASFIVLLLESRGVDHGATVFAAFAAMIVLARLVAGHLPDLVGPARVAIGATLVEAVGLFAIAISHSLLVALLGAMAMGAAFSLLNPSLMLIAVGRVSETARGAAMGTYTAFFDTGIGIGAPLAGLAAALTSYEGAFVLAGLVALGSSAMVLVTLHRAGVTHRPEPSLPNAE
ncbi:MAG TPA: MFS transporter [Solirubrobacterales bacterium]|nr:MFS transporter [Solirubrobacterales bacterium]